MEDRPSPLQSSRSEVDTSRPFRSVKEAVAVLGERILAGEFHAHKQQNVVIQERRSWNSSSSASSFASLPPIKREEDESAVMDSIKKLEADLEETRRELKLLKERESETEIAVASLNAEVHMSMSKLAKAEAAEAAKAVTRSALALGGKQEIVEEETKVKPGMSLKQSQCLAEILSLGENEGFFGTPTRSKKTTKKKPIVPLIWNIFLRKKSPDNHFNPLYTIPHHI
ncbi:WEB family protein At1g75720 [Aristolochia californica]|uniref:WEB family protein At1g75720 n=1 Tax=Aristolochia californica TaxID=171875 RepID=UPI0035E34A44